MNPMVEMSRAIRETHQRYSHTLEDLPDDVLRDFATIVSAYALDLRDELNRRELSPPESRSPGKRHDAMRAALGMGTEDAP